MNTEAITNLLSEAEKPLSLEELCTKAGFLPADRPLLEAALRDMAAKGLIARAGKRYASLQAAGLQAGRLQGTRGEYCFFIPDGQTDDLYIAAARLNGGMHGDRVLARRLPERSEGEVAQVLERKYRQVVGTYIIRDGFACLRPDDKKLSGAKLYIGEQSLDPKLEGFKVVAEITQYPTPRRNHAVVTIKEVLGHAQDAATDTLSVIRTYGYSESFPAAALAAAESISQEIPSFEYANRRDLRGEKIVTIDGADSKDLDDAVSLTPLPDNCWRLGVHIADVASYVQVGSPLDKEALARGTSVYLINWVIPMLPEALSNGICSLNPHCDRLALSVSMDFSPEGELLNYEIFKSVIRNCERLVYDDVTKLLSHNDAALSTRYGNILEELYNFEKLQKILQRRRTARGSIDFDLHEAKIKLDANGRPTSIEREPRGIANRIIEEFMLAANETVAYHMQKQSLPALYRVHELPDRERLTQLNEFLHSFGYHLRLEGDTIKPAAVSSLLKKLEGTPEQGMINRVVLRSMRKARYTPQNLGHFGLAAINYLHFTSPIRRYPDLVVHRVLHWWLEGKQAEMAAYGALLDKIGLEASEKERASEEAERDLDDWKKAEYMQDKVGTEYEGVVSGVGQMGLWVELPNTVEGLIRIANLEDDYYEFLEKQYCLMGRRTRRKYSLGDTLRVRVAAVSVEERRVEFVPAENTGKQAFAPKKQNGKWTPAEQQEQKKQFKKTGSHRRKH